jgi:hypothetical protein
VRFNPLVVIPSIGKVVFVFIDIFQPHIVVFKGGGQRSWAWAVVFGDKVKIAAIPFAIDIH